MGWVHLTTSAQNSACDAVLGLVDGGSSAGYILIYAADGDGIPASADTAVTNQTELGRLDMSDPAYAPASAGVAGANTISPETSATGTGTAAWARIHDSNGIAVFDVDVGVTASGATIELDSASISVGGTIEVTALDITMPSGV